MNRRRHKQLSPTRSSPAWDLMLRRDPSRRQFETLQPGGDTLNDVEPYNVQFQRGLYEGEPLNSDTTISGYDREWLLITSPSPAHWKWQHAVQSADLTNNPSPSIWEYTTKCKPFRYRIGYNVANTTDNRIDYLRLTGPPAAGTRHFASAMVQQFEVWTEIQSGLILSGVTNKSSLDYARIVIDGVEYGPYTISTTGFVDARFGESYYNKNTSFFVTLPNPVDITNADIFIDVWITTRVRFIVAIADPSDSSWDTMDDQIEYEGRGRLGAIAVAENWLPGYARANLGPNKLNKKKYEVTFDRSDIGGETSVIIGERSDPVVTTTERIRPAGYDGGLVWAVPNWQNIDEAITQPAAGDGNTARKDGAAAQYQGYQCTGVVGSGTTKKITLWIQAKCDIADGDCSITQYYTRVPGGQETVTTSIPLTTSYVWYSFERVVVATVPFATGAFFGIRIAGTSASSKAYVETAYIEVEYDEEPEWTFTRNEALGRKRLTHNPSGDYVELLFGPELPQIDFYKPSLASSPYEGKCSYRRNTDTHYSQFELIVPDGGTPYDSSLKGDAWDGKSAAVFDLQWRPISGSSSRFNPGTVAAIYPTPSHPIYDPDDSLFIDFPKHISIAPV